MEAPESRKIASEASLTQQSAKPQGQQAQHNEAPLETNQKTSTNHGSSTFEKLVCGAMSLPRLTPNGAIV